jgi:hypothetical protein
MNPLNGIKISAFRNAATLSAGQDRELSLLQRYLHLVAERNVDFRRANHQVSIAFALCACLAYSLTSSKQWRQVSKHLHKGGRVEYNEATGDFTLTQRH